MEMEDQPTTGSDAVRSGPTATPPATVTGDNRAAETSVIAEQQWYARAVDLVPDFRTV
jgi:hypothetical protein